MISSNPHKWTVGAATLAAVGFASLSALHAQTILYRTTFDASEGYTTPTTLSGQPGAGNAGSWDTNDPDNGVTTGAGGKTIGQSDYVGFLQGYSSGVAATSTDYWGALGGLQHNSASGSYTGVIPGQSTAYLYRPFAVPTTTNSLAFDVDFAIPQSTGTTGPTGSANDTFGWTFQSGGVNLFSATFAPSGIDASTGLLKFGLRYSVNNATPTSTGNGILSSSVYHLKISVNVTNNTFNIQLVPSNGNPAYQSGNISLNGLDPKTIDRISATWTLTDTTNQTNGGYNNAGTNALIFNNYTISVPEPSTWAISGLALAGLMIIAYRRRATA